MNALIRNTNPVNSITDFLEELFDDNYINFGNRDLDRRRWPEVDVVENKDGYELRADIPGVDKKDINISVENDVLTVSGEKKEERRREDDKYYSYFERSYGKFSRSFNLPEDIDRENISANYKNGILTLSLNKSEKAKPKSIDVKIS